MNLIPTLYAESVDEFLNLLAKRNSIWHEHNSPENLWVYRGQWEPNGRLCPLLPSALRRNRAWQRVKEQILAEAQATGHPIDAMAKNIVKNLRKESRNKTNLLKHPAAYHACLEKMNAKTRKHLEHIMVQSMLEFMLVQRFVENCNKAALYIDDAEVTIEYKAFDQWLKIRAEEAKFKLYEIAHNWLLATQQLEKVAGIKSYSPFFNYTSYYPLALAQHSGIPSRLLDWSYHPLIAAFFATPKSSQSYQGEICVYAFNLRYQRDSLMARNSLSIHAHTKQHQFDFLHAQKGIFTEMRGADVYYLKYGKWPSLAEHILEFDEYAACNKDIYNLKKIVLSGEFADELRRELAAEDITQATLMPTYFHCAEYVMGK